MQVITGKPHGEGTNEEFEAPVNALRLAILNNLLQKAFTHHYWVTEQEAETLQDLFPSRPVFQDPNARHLHHSQHAVLAVLNEYANEHASHLAHTLRNTMTIGDAANVKIKTAHNCMLIANKRDACRVVANCQAERSTNSAYMNKAEHNKSTIICANGAENCPWQADVAFAVHSLYDVSQETVARIFEKHNLREMYVYMYIPNGFCHPLLENTDVQYFLTHNNGAETVFTLRDASACYSHNTKTWKDWIKITCIEAGEYAIVKEVFAKHGPLYIFRLTRIYNFPGKSIMCHPLADLVKEVGFVPSFRDAMNHRFSKKQSELKHYTVPSHVLSILLSYAQRQHDEAYKFTELVACAGGLRRDLRIGSTLYAKRWDIGADDFTDAVCSIFIIGAIQRTERTSTISTCFRHFKEWSKSGDFTWSMRTMFNNFLNFVDPHKDKATGEATKTWQFEVVYLTDQWYANHVHVKPIAPRSEAIAIEQDYGDDDVEVAELLLEPKDTVVPAKVVSTADTASLDTRDNISLSSYNSAVSVSPTFLSEPFSLLPHSFKVGHCFISSIWQLYYPANARPSQKNFLTQIWKYAMQHQCNNIKCFVQASQYLRHGDYDNEHFDCLVQYLPAALDVAIHVHTSDQSNNVTTVYNPSGHRPIHMSYRDNHFEPYVQRGGSGTPKFAALAAYYDFSGRDVFEVSAAPGVMASIIAPICDYTFGHYTRGLQVNKAYIVTTGHIDIAGKRCHYYPYDNVHKLKSYKYNHGTVFCDAAANAYTETLLQAIVPHAHSIVAEGGDLIIKAFINMQTICNVAAYYETMEMWRDPDTHGAERYYILKSKSKQLLHSAAMLFRDNAEPITVHEIIYDHKTTVNFINKYFISMEKYKPDVAEMPKHNFTIRACTGFASASKTTTIAEQYPNAVFVAPSGKLRDEHLQKFHMRSFTPHVVFQNLAQIGTIIVDEISQLPVEYLMALHAAKPTMEIIVVGDIYQVPYINFQSADKFTHIAAIGVENNINTVYKIPQDITTVLNDKYKYNIISMSPVQHSVCIVDNLDKVKHLPIIVFNDATQKNLCSRGFKANTITTFEGSREDAVVFYIDDKAITSQLANRAEWMYTAVTRHRNQLVLAGNTQYITKYFHLLGTNIPTFEMFSSISLVNEVHAVKLREIDDCFRTDSDAQSIRTATAIDYISTECATDIVKSAFRTNEGPESYVRNTLPDVQQGTISIDAINLVTPAPIKRGYKIADNVPTVIPQVSNDNYQTAYTLIKRYATKSKITRPMQSKIMLNQLQRGLCKGLYGNEHSLSKLAIDMQCSPEELRRCYAEYVVSLQQKIDTTQQESSIVRELDQEMNFYDEILVFIQKNQGKFSPKDDCRDTDKAGQGVAAMSKRINIMLCAYARLMSYKLSHIAKMGGKQVHFATHGSDTDTADVLRAYEQMGSAHNKKFACNDYSEWDIHFITCFSMLTHYLLECMSINKYLNDYFLEYRKHWKMFHTTNKSKTTTLSGKSKQFSGNPFTLVENTNGNFALTNFLWDFKKLSYSLFKGDDSAVKCADATPTQEGLAFLTVSKHKLKFTLSDIGEFAGFFISEGFVGPDLYRRTAKFLGATYKHQLHFEQSRLNTIAAANVITSQRELEHIALATAIHYGFDRVQPEQIKMLHGFLRDVAPHIKFEHLHATVDDAVDLS